MNRSSRCLLALPALALATALAACSSSSNGGFGPGEDSGTPEGGEDATTEASSPEAGTGDSTAPGADASRDAGEQAEAGVDAHVEAGNLVESGTEDSMAPEASSPEASTPEASSPEASTPEASTPDSSTGDATASGDSGTTDAGVADGSDGGGPTFVPPVCDGVISSGEYGNQTDGANQQTTGSQVWYMTWSSTTVYVGITNADTSEGAVMYFSDDPAIDADAGTTANGSTAGFTYDSVGIAQLPVHAQLVAYVKGSYNETRTDDGNGGWSTQQVANALTVCTGANNTREFSIPWATITGGALPSSFGWLGYLASGVGFVYGQVPLGNPAGTVGASAVFPWFYDVTNATPVTGTLPFANAVQR